MIALRKSTREVRDALKVAREGTPSSRKKAEEAATKVQNAIINSEPGYLTLGTGSYIRSARYYENLKEAYPNASDKAIRSAAYELSWADSPLPTRRRHIELEERARSEIANVIAENKSNRAGKARSFTSLRR